MVDRPNRSQRSRTPSTASSHRSYSGAHRQRYAVAPISHPKMVTGSGTGQRAGGGTHAHNSVRPYSPPQARVHHTRRPLRSHSKGAATGGIGKNSLVTFSASSQLVSEHHGAEFYAANYWEPQDLAHSEQRELVNSANMLQPIQSGTQLYSAAYASGPQLEGAWVDTFRGRLQSLSKLRLQLEEITEMHKTEEKRFIETIRMLVRAGGSPLLKGPMVHATHGVSVSHQQDWILAEAEREKTAALQMFSTFKTQATEIISDLKSALNGTSERCDALVHENKMLKNLLQEVHQRQGGGPLDMKRITNWLEHVASEDRIVELEKRVNEYRSMLEEEDTIIQELQHRNKVLENRTETLRQQRDKLLDVDATKNEDFEGEYKELLLILRAEPNEDEQMAAPSVLHERLAQQKKLIQMLTLKLKAEQRERLRIEEQSARLAAEQDKLLRKLETKSINLHRSTPKSTPCRRNVSQNGIVQTPHTNPSQPAMNANNPSSQQSITPKFESQHVKADDFLDPSEENHSNRNSMSLPRELHSESNPESSRLALFTDHEPSKLIEIEAAKAGRIKNHSLSNKVPIDRTTASNQNFPENVPHHPISSCDRDFNSSLNSHRSIDDAEAVPPSMSLRSLEDQLAEVSRDLTASLQMWRTKLSDTSSDTFSQTAPEKDTLNVEGVVTAQRDEEVCDSGASRHDTAVYVPPLAIRAVHDSHVLGDKRQVSSCREENLLESLNNGESYINEAEFAPDPLHPARD